MRIATIILLNIFFVTSIFAQKTVRITGTVTDSDGSPLEFAHIRAKNGIGGTLSDFKGKYELSVHYADSMTIVFSSLGYKRVSRLLMNPTEEVTINVRMYTDVEALGEVEVTANRIQTDMLEKIDVGKAKLLPSASGNGVEALLKTMAGVNSSNELSSQYSVRGGNFDENIVYVNGIEVYRPLLVRSGQQEGLSFINSDMVESLGFSSGGYAAEYGDKMASVLDITYKKPQAFEGSVSASLQGATASVGQSFKNFTQLHGIRYKRNSLLLNTLDTKGEYDPSFVDYQVYLTYKVNEKLGVSFLGNISQNDYRFRPESRTTSFGTLESAKQFKVYFDGQEKDLFRTFFGAFSMNYKADQNNTIDLLFSAFKTDEKETYDITGEYWLDEAQGSDQDGQGSLGVGSYHEHARNKLNASVVAAAIKGVSNIKGHKIGYGVNLQFEKISDKVSEWEMRDSSGYSLPHTGESLEMIYSLHSSYNLNTTRFGAYIQDTYRFESDLGRFTLTGGIRGSYWSFNKEFIFSPRVSLGFIPKNISNLTTRFATGIYYQIGRAHV